MTTGAILLLYGITGAGMFAMYRIFYPAGNRDNR